MSKVIKYKYLAASCDILENILEYQNISFPYKYVESLLLNVILKGNLFLTHLGGIRMLFCQIGLIDCSVLIYPLKPMQVV